MEHYQVENEMSHEGGRSRFQSFLRWGQNISSTVLLIVMLALLALMCVLVLSASAQVPRTISYQGMLTSGDAPANGPHIITVTLYDSLAGGTQLYQESHQLTVTNGIFDMEIGSISPLPATLTFNVPYYLGVSIDGSAELSPRVPLDAAPYAMNAGTAQLAEGLTSNAHGVVTSINELAGALRITGDSITTVTENGNEITIHAKATVSGIQSIASPDKTIAITNGMGPNATVGVADSAITTAKLANAAVTPQKLAQAGAAKGQVLKWNGSAWAVANDSAGSASYIAGQGISISGNTISAAGGLPAGTVLNSTLRWNGASWVENQNMTSDANGNTRIDGTTNLGDGIGADNITMSPGTGQIQVNGWNQGVVMSSAAGVLSTSQLTGGAGISITQNANAITITDTGSVGWALTGNTGTSAPTNFLGTIDNQPFEIHIDNNDGAGHGSKRVLRFEPNATSANIIAGYQGNAANANVVGATIAGGGLNGYNNTVTDDFGVVGGGSLNRAGNNSGSNQDASHATVAGGGGNTASGIYSSILGGTGNTASSNSATIGGGSSNQATGAYATVTGGIANTANDTVAVVGGGGNTAGKFSTIPGGRNLTLGSNGFGVNVNGSGNTLDLSAYQNLAYFGDMDVWLGNLDNSASALRFYAPGTNVNYSARPYSAFLAGTQSATINYTLPITQPSANQVLTATNITGTGPYNVTMGWSTSSGGGNAWNLTGNSGTTPGTNFLGTTDNKAMEILVESGSTVNNSLILNTNGSIQRDIDGNARGAGAVDLQSSQHASEVASGLASSIGGGYGNTALGNGGTIGGGGYNFDSAEYSTIGGGADDTAYFPYDVIGGGGANYIGAGSKSGTGQFSLIAGGRQNKLFGQESGILSGSYLALDGDRNVISGGSNNSIHSNYSFLGGGTNNIINDPTSGSFYSNPFSVLVGGEYNYISNPYVFLGGGLNNAVEQDYGVVVGGMNDTLLSGRNAVVSGGSFNSISGSYSAIPGGDSLRLGAYSFGMNVSSSNSTLSRTDLTGFSNLAYFGNMDIWLGNTDNTARALRFYAPSSSTSYSTRPYSAFLAGGQTATINYTLPTSQPSANQVLAATAITGSGPYAVTLGWASASGNDWGLTGNSGTTDGTNFLGTTDNVPFTIRANNVQALRIQPYHNAVPSTIGGGTGNSIASGDTASFIGFGDSNRIGASYSSIIGGNSDTLTGDYSSISAGYGNTVTGEVSAISGGTGNSVSGYYSMIAGGYLDTIPGTYDGFVGAGAYNVVKDENGAIAGGELNTAFLNAFVGGGIANLAGASSHSGSAILGGAHNTVTGDNSVIAGGQSNQIPLGALYTGVIAGVSNYAGGSNSAIAGGGYLRMTGNNSFGFHAGSSSTDSAAITTANTAYFGNVNLWLGNTNNTASELRFYGAQNGGVIFPGASTHYTSFAAAGQTADINYTLPSTAPSANQVLAATAISGTGPYAVTLGWTNGSGTGWGLTGNSGTTAGTNFLGTTDNEAMEILVKDGATVNNSMILNPNGSIQRDNNGSARGIQAVDLQMARTSTNEVATGNLSVISGGSQNLVQADSATIGGGSRNIGLGIGGVISGGTGNTINGQPYSTIAGGSNNDVDADFGVISGGENNYNQGRVSTIAGGFSNLSMGDSSFIGGGVNNMTTAIYSAVVGGAYNRVMGNSSTIVGGRKLQLEGDGSFGFHNGSNATDSARITANGTAFFGNVNLWLGNTNNTASQLRFYGAQNGGVNFPGASTHYSSFSAASQSTDINYTLPSSSPSANGNLLLASSGSSSTMAWSSNLVWDNTNSRLGINTTSPAHALHSVYSGTSDEYAAIFGNATGSTTNQSIGVWGDASNTTTTNTGTIGVLATGNGNTTAGQTNVALQINDGEFTMGRTTEAPGTGTDVEAATGGTAYTQQGPSGIVELTLGAAGNLATSAPTSGTIQDLGAVTINNRYCESGSIVLVNVVGMTDDGSAPNPQNAAWIVNADNTASGSFVVRIKMIPTQTSASNYSTSDKVRIGYMIVNKSK